MLARTTMRTTTLDLIRVEWNISAPPLHSAAAAGSNCSQSGNDAEENCYNEENPDHFASGMEHCDTSMMSCFQSPTLGAKVRFSASVATAGSQCACGSDYAAENDDDEDNPGPDTSGMEHFNTSMI
jgi:hypothetical protein